MNLQKLFMKLMFVFLILMTQITQLQAAEHMIVPKFGVVNRGDNTNHHVDNNSFNFDDDSVVSLGVTYLYRMDNGYAFGADFYGYENKIITTANNNGDAKTGHLYGVFQKYINSDGTIQPYIGVGIGLVSVSFDANISGAISDDFEDNAIGLSYEVILGSEFSISKNLGVILEYKYFDFNVDDDIADRNVEIESDGQAVFVGASIHF